MILTAYQTQEKGSGISSLPAARIWLALDGFFPSFFSFPAGARPVLQARNSWQVYRDVFLAGRADAIPSVCIKESFHFFPFKMELCAVALSRRWWDCCPWFPSFYLELQQVEPTWRVTTPSPPSPPPLDKLETGWPEQTQHQVMSTEVLESSDLFLSCIFFFTRKGMQAGSAQALPDSWIFSEEAAMWKLPFQFFLPFLSFQWCLSWETSACCF